MSRGHFYFFSLPPFPFVIASPDCIGAWQSRWGCNVVRGFSLVLHDPEGSHYKNYKNLRGLINQATTEMSGRDKPRPYGIGQITSTKSLR